MLCMIKSFLAGNGKADQSITKDEFTRAKNDLETIILLTQTDFSRRYESAVSAAIRLRKALSLGVDLSTNEKIELVKLINQVKVKTVSAGDHESYRAFQVLDSVSEDIKKYL